MVLKKNIPASLSVEMLAEFAAGAGHDLNNPLAAIGGRVQLLLQSETDAAKRYDLAAILAQVKRAQAMIADLRQIARPPLLEKKDVALRAFLERLGEDFQPECDERKIVWSLLWEPAGEVVLGADPSQLHGIFQALIRNSLRAMANAGTLEIRVAARAKKVEIRVTDTGHGIAEEIRPLIFDPYYSSYQSGRGLGFGLTKARIFARLHGGEVVLESGEPGATTFLVTLPGGLPGMCKPTPHPGQGRPEA
ncbi:MAG: HAMP domain-containing sensor histidine kinase [Planctomycetia bacterium]|nr:HAMP domain-containing sensor histidine kinase [Planctomycetia bacterium]